MVLQPFGSDLIPRLSHSQQRWFERGGKQKRARPATMDLVDVYRGEEAPAERKLLALGRRQFSRRQGVA
jgi:hypothetical protein